MKGVPAKKRGVLALAIGAGVLFVIACVLLVHFLTRKDEPKSRGDPGPAVATTEVAARKLEALEALEAARGLEAAAVAAAKKAEDAKAAALAEQAGTELRAKLAAEAARLVAEASAAAKAAAEAAAEAAASAAASADSDGRAKPDRRSNLARAPSEIPAGTETPVPVVSETTLPSWPFEVGESGASCAATCEGKRLVCDEERQASATYGREIAYEALVRAGVVQNEQSEDEWHGSLRVRDDVTASGDHARAIPGLWMRGSMAEPNWKSERHTTVRSTCAASHAGLRRVCACKAPVPFSGPSPGPSPVASPGPSPAASPVETSAPPPWTPALSAGERATGLVTRFAYERGKGFFPNVPESGGPSPAIRRYLIPESNALFGEHGTFVLVIDLVDGALERLGEDGLQLFKISEVNNTGDPEITLSRERGIRVAEHGAGREVSPPAYYAGTKLVYINDRAKKDAEMLVRGKDGTITLKMHVAWSGTTNGNMEVQLHDLVKRAVFLWGLDTVALDVSALKAEV